MSGLLTLSYEYVSAGPVLTGLLCIMVLASLVAVMFPGVRRVNSLFAPILVVLTLLVTGIALGTVLYLVDRFNLVN